MGKTFKKVVLCSTNDFAKDKNDKIKGWVEHNGGRFSGEISSDVTHLVASKQAWKSYTPLVKQARRMRTIKIVTLDWLEDSLLSTSRRPLNTTPYEFERDRKRAAQPENLAENEQKRTVDRSRKKRKIVARRQREFNKSCRDVETKMGIEGYHPYKDSSNNTYLITLVRQDMSRNRVETHGLKVRDYFNTRDRLTFPVKSRFRYLPFNRKLRVDVPQPLSEFLQLYESDALPRTYACYTMYERTDIRPQIQVLAPQGSPWTFAFDMFSKFFSKRCGFEWSEAVGGQHSHVDVDIDIDRSDFFVWQNSSQARIVNDQTSIEVEDFEKAKTPEQGW